MDEEKEATTEQEPEPKAGGKREKPGDALHTERIVEPVEVEAEICIPVRVLNKQGASALVEWAEGGRPRCGYIPKTEVLPDSTVPETVLAKAAPHGLAWEDVPFDHKNIPERLADALRNRGIWTAEDLAHNPQGAIGAIQATLRLHVGALNEFAKEA